MADVLTPARGRVQTFLHETTSVLLSEYSAGVFLLLFLYCFVLKWMDVLSITMTEFLSGSD